jgi:hypothetical protein
VVAQPNCPPRHYHRELTLRGACSAHLLCLFLAGKREVERREQVVLAQYDGAGGNAMACAESTVET